MIAASSFSEYATGPQALTWALRLAALGLRVFPCKPGSKVPRLDGWQQAATTDAETIKEWLRTGGNYGVVGGGTRTNPETGMNDYLSLVDIDQKHGKDGAASLRRACASSGVKLGDFPTFTVETPSGGGHLYFWSPVPIRYGADVLGPGSGVDIRSEGKGYLVGPGSIVDGKAYTVAQDVPIASMGPLASIFARAPQEDRQAAREPLPGVDGARAVGRAEEFLKSTPGAVEGARGSTAYKLACRAKDFGVSEDEALMLMDLLWKDRCEPPMPDADLEKSVAHAYRYGKEPQGSAAPEAAFPAAPPSAEVDNGIHPLDAMNREWAFIMEKAYLLRETTDEDEKPTIRTYTVPEFHACHENRPFQVGDQKPKPISKHWMAWASRREYEGVTFSPESNPGPRWFNLWRGFGVEPKAGSWDLMRKHIRDVICSGNEAVDHYVMGWLAFAVQKPGTPPGVALVLRGGKGVGKGTLGNEMVRILGNHGLHLSKADDLLGKFNYHLRYTSFLFADEAFWAGDKQHEGTLKAYITEPTIMIQQKFVDGGPRPNRLHILMASNADWVVPASADERRFCVLEVSAHCRGDHGYWTKLKAQMDNGGREAMLYDLLRHDIRRFNIREVPQTKALLEQKFESLHSHVLWLFECLQDGMINGEPWLDTPICVQRRQTHEAYASSTMRHKRYHHPEGYNSFWKKVRAILHIPEQGPRPRSNVEGATRARATVLPGLLEARASFSRYIGDAIDWQDPEREPPGEAFS